MRILILFTALFLALPFANVAADEHTDGLHCEQGICWTAGLRHDGWYCPEGTDPCYPVNHETPVTPCFAWCRDGMPAGH